MRTPMEIEAALKSIKREKEKCFERLDYEGGLLMSGVEDGFKWALGIRDEHVDRLDKAIAESQRNATIHERN